MTDDSQSQSLHAKYHLLQQMLQEMRSVAVAFSGGVDSTLLLRTARDVLGAEQVLALTANSPTYPHFEFEQSRQLAAAMGVEQLVVASNELELPAFSENTPQRCYHCKHELFSRFRELARERKIAHLLDGSNLDDQQDYRPGRQAVAELQIRSPLLEAGLNKADIRQLSRQLELPTWDKQPFACLASRFPYGTRITAERLNQIDRCEAFLRRQGFLNYRVRYHDVLARIEVPAAEISRLLDGELRKTLLAEFKAAGFTYVTLDLEGYRSGSMNETLSESERKSSNT